MNKFYRWPCGMFESLGGPWVLMFYRPMPSTPAGDKVAEFATRENCDTAVDEAMAADFDLEQARARFGAH